MITYCRRRIILLQGLFIIAGCNNNTAKVQETVDNTNKEEVQKVNSVIYKLIEADNRSDIAAVLACYDDHIEFIHETKKIFGWNR